MSHDNSRGTQKTKRPHEGAGAVNTELSKKSKINKNPILTVDEILQDPITEIANLYWAPSPTPHLTYDASIIEKIYYDNIIHAEVGAPKLKLLDLSSYLENYLWKHFHAETSSYAHVMSIVALINEKFRDNVYNTWDSLIASRDEITLQDFLSTFLRIRSRFQKSVIPSAVEDEKKKDNGEESEKVEKVEKSVESTKYIYPPRYSFMFAREMSEFVTFLIHAFNSLENDTIRPSVLSLVSLPLWSHMSSNSIKKGLILHPEFETTWSKLQGVIQKMRKAEKTPGASLERFEKLQFQMNFIPSLLQEFFHVLRFVGDESTRFSQGLPFILESVFESEIQVQTANVTKKAHELHLEQTRIAEKRLHELYVKSLTDSKHHKGKGGMKGRKGKFGSKNGKNDKFGGKNGKFGQEKQSELEIYKAEIRENQRRVQRDLKSSLSSILGTPSIANGSSNPNSMNVRLYTNSLLQGISTIRARSLNEILHLIVYLERIVELLIDFLSQLPLRKYIKLLLDDLQIVQHIQLSPFIRKFFSAGGRNSRSSSRNINGKVKEIIQSIHSKQESNGVDNDSDSSSDDSDSDSGSDSDSDSDSDSSSDDESKSTSESSDSDSDSDFETETETTKTV